MKTIEELSQEVGTLKAELEKTKNAKEEINTKAKERLDKINKLEEQVNTYKPFYDNHLSTKEKEQEKIISEFGKENEEKVKDYFSKGLSIDEIKVLVKPVELKPATNTGGTKPSEKTITNDKELFETQI